MKFNKAVKLLSSIIFCLLAGVIGSVFTTPAIQGWYVGVNKPSFNPPNWIFGPVWSLLFVLMGVSLYIVWINNFEVKNKIGNEEKSWNSLTDKFLSGEWQKLNIILIFAVQLILNILWSVIFFGLQNPGVAFFELIALWVAIIYTIVNFYRVSKLAGYLLIPYVLWVSFAGVLNFMIWILN
jgi:tryptophan-rich sensory protein